MGAFFIILALILFHDSLAIGVNKIIAELKEINMKLAKLTEADQ